LSRWVWPQASKFFKIEFRLTPHHQADFITMNAKEIAERVRIEATELEALVKKLQFRLEHLKWLAESLEINANPKAGKQQPAPPVSESKFRKLIDKVYGEKPRLGGKS
jgi:hypothetical protein